MKKKYNRTFCNKLFVSRKQKVLHLKYEKQKLYKKLIKRYDYVNKLIVKQIIKTYTYN